MYFKASDGDGPRLVLGDSTAGTMVSIQHNCVHACSIGKH